MTIALFLEGINWFMTFAAVLGAFLVARQQIAGQVIWLFTNSTFIVYNAYHGTYAYCFLFGVYLCITIYALYFWMGQKPNKGKAS